MALNKVLLQDRLSSFIDSNSQSFNKFPTTPTEVAEFWADAVDAYAQGVIPVSTGQTLAKNALISQFINITSSEIAPPFIVTGFTNYAIQLGLGMSPAFVATPPPLPIDFSVIAPAGFAGASAAQQVASLATIIDTWFRTGTAVPSGGGAPINWS